MGTLRPTNALKLQKQSALVLPKRRKFSPGSLRRVFEMGLKMTVTVLLGLVLGNNAFGQDSRPVASTTTIVVPMVKKNPVDTPTTNRATARVKPTNAIAPKVNARGQTIIGEPFCDVRFEGETVIFEKVSIADKDIKVTVDLHNEAGGNFQKDAVIVFVRQTSSVFVHNGNLLAHYRFVKDTKKYGGLDLEQVVITETKGLPFSKNPIVSKAGSLVIFSQDDYSIIYETAGSGRGSVHSLEGRLFTHPGAIYEDVEKGVFVASTPVAAIFKVGGKATAWNFKNLTGIDAFPSLENITISMERGWIRIDSPTMRNSAGEQFKILVNPNTVHLEEGGVQMLKISTIPSDIVMR